MEIPLLTFYEKKQSFMMVSFCLFISCMWNFKRWALSQCQVAFLLAPRPSYTSDYAGADPGFCVGGSRNPKSGVFLMRDAGSWLIAVYLMVVLVWLGSGKVRPRPRCSGLNKHVNFGVCLFLTGVREVPEPSHTSTTNGLILNPLFPYPTSAPPHQRPSPRGLNGEKTKIKWAVHKVQCCPKKRNSWSFLPDPPKTKLTKHWK